MFPLGSAPDTFGQIFLTLCCSILSSVKCTGKNPHLCAAVVRLRLTLSGGLDVMGKILWKQAAVKNLSFQLLNFKDFVTALTGCLVIRAAAQSPQLLADVEVMGSYVNPHC